MSPLELDYLITTSQVEKAFEWIAKWNATHTKQISGNMWHWYYRRQSAWSRGWLMDLGPGPPYHGWRRVDDELHIAMPGGTVVVSHDEMCKLLSRRDVMIPSYWGSFDLIREGSWITLAWAEVPVSDWVGCHPLQSDRIRQWSWRIRNPSG